MPYLNSWRRALVAMVLLLAAVPGLHAQEVSSAASEPIRGDVDGDGRVTRADADAVRAYLVRGTLPSGRSILPGGDANGDGRVTAADAALISRFAAGMDVSRFPVGRPVGAGRGGEGGQSDSSLLTAEQFCEVDTEAGTVTCGDVTGGGTSVQNIAVGTPYVTFDTTTSHSRGSSANEDTTTYSVAIRNAIPQPLGTTDGATLAPGGIRLFFTVAPKVQLVRWGTLASATIRLEGHNGTDDFANQDSSLTWDDRMFVQYDTVLPEGGTTRPDTVRFIYSSNVKKFRYQYRVSAPAEFEFGWIDISPATPPVLAPGGTTTLTPTIFNQVGDVVADGVTWASSDSAVATVDASGVVTGVSGGTTTITAASTTYPTERLGTRVIQVIEAVDDAFGTTVLGNVDISSSSFSVSTNDVLHGSATIDNPGVPITTTQGGTAVVQANGTFTYDPPAGYEGADSFDYTIESGTATSTGTVSLTVGGMIWFVDADAAAECTTHCGRKSSPFKALATFNTANQAGGSSNPADNEAVFLYEGASYTDSVVLRTGQKLIGQDATASLATLAGVTVPTGSTLPPTNSGNADRVILAGADGVNLAQSNSLYGFTLEPTAGQAIGSGAGFTSLTVDDLTINAAGQALSLTTGSLVGDFDRLISRGGTNNVLLSGVSTSTPIALGTSADSLVGATGDAVVITNGDGTFTYAGTIRNVTSRAVNVSGKTAGTVTFSGDINPGVAGTGISASGNSGGTITFSGAAKNISSGTSAGVSLTGNTGATIAFTNGGLTVASTTGVPFTATGGGTVEVSGAGNTLSVSGASAGAVNLNGMALAAGGMSFASISSTGVTTGSAFSATSVSGGSFTAGSLTVAGTTGGTSRGIALTTNSAPFTFTTASVNGTGAEGIFLSGNTGAVSVTGGTVGNSASPTGDALSISGGNAAVTVNAALTKNSAGRIANIASRTGGAVTVSGALSCTGACTGILGNANAGTIDFTSVTKTLTTAANPAVTLTNNTGTISFTNGGLVISTTSGAGFSASGGGTVNVEGTTNTVTSTTGTAVSISSTTIGANGVQFRSVSASGAANGIFLNNTGISGGQFQVTGDGSTPASGGTITNTSGGDGATGGNGIYLNTVRNVNLSWMALSGHANNGLYGTGVRGLTVNKVRFTGNNGTSNSGSFNESAVHLVNLGGAVKFSGSRFDGGAMNAVRVDNSTGTAPALDSLVFVNDTVATMQGSTADVRGSALLVTLMDGTADVRFRDNRVLAWWSTGIHALVQGTASGTVRINNNFVDNTNGALAGATGIVAAGCRLDFNISGNTIRHTNGAAISSDMSPGCVNTVQGTIDGNFIGVSGDINSGTATGVAIGVGGRAGTTTVKISNNVLRQINGSANGAITAVAGDNVLYGGSGTLNATISGNNIQETGSTVNSAQHGILVTHGTTSSGANDSHQGCYDILNNTIANLNTASGAAAQNRIRVNQRFGTTSRFPGYTGGQFSTTDLASYLLSRNTASNSTNANSSTGGFLNTVPAGSACPQPTM